MGVKGNSCEASENKKESWRESLHLLRDYINNHEQSVGRNMNIKVHSDESQMQIKNGYWEMDKR